MNVGWKLPGPSWLRLRVMEPIKGPEIAIHVVLCFRFLWSLGISAQAPGTVRPLVGRRLVGNGVGVSQ
jgi:hypothetical protein